ncbi:hypothetical protein LXA43DRAFT_1103019 [Ganoderma leucocontextum]|nr:hypothetical protein LXA43DRAFT_1103019 [Ganoderma leucocontextum]
MWVDREDDGTGERGDLVSFLCAGEKPPSSRSQFSRLIADGGGPLVHIATTVVGAIAVMAGADDFDHFNNFQTVPPSAAAANNTFFSAATTTPTVPTSLHPPLAAQSFSPPPAQAANNNLFNMFSTDTLPALNMNMMRAMMALSPPMMGSAPLVPN